MEAFERSSDLEVTLKYNCVLFPFPAALQIWRQAIRYGSVWEKEMEEKEMKKVRRDKG